MHRALYDVLNNAPSAACWTPIPVGVTPEQLGKQMGIYDIAGLRPPKKARRIAAQLPLLGLAIDINHDTNPFVGNMRPDKHSPRYAEFSANRSPRMIERAMWLLEGEQFDVEEKALAKQLENLSAGKAWDIHQRASRALAEYLRLADDLDGSRLRELVANAQLRGEEQNLDLVEEPHSHRSQGDQALGLPRPQASTEVRIHGSPGVNSSSPAADAGLLWGGTYRTAKDIMHFDLRDGPFGIDRSEGEHDG